MNGVINGKNYNASALGFPTFRSRQMRGFMVVESKAGQSTDVPGQKPPTTEPPRDEQSKLPF